MNGVRRGNSSAVVCGRAVADDVVTTLGYHWKRNEEGNGGEGRNNSGVRRTIISGRGQYSITILMTDHVDARKMDPSGGGAIE